MIDLEIRGGAARADVGADAARRGEAAPGDSSCPEGGGLSDNPDVGDPCPGDTICDTRTGESGTGGAEIASTDTDTGGGGAAGSGDVLDRLGLARLRRLRAQADELSLTVEACVAHRVDEEAADRGLERLIRGGAEGTPLVGEFLAHELAVVLQISPTSAAFKMAQALNLKYRHPRLWAAVQELTVEPWQATRVATDCANAGLDAAAAGWVDDRLATAAVTLPWPRALRLVAGLIVTADPTLAAIRAERARNEHAVHLGEVVDGSTTVFARLGARDGLFLDGMVDRLADILTSHGEAGSRQQLRARALGILATPAYATHLLADAARPLPGVTGALRPGSVAASDPSEASTVTGPSQRWSAAESASDSWQAGVERPGVLDLTGIDPDKLLPKATLYVHLSGHCLTSDPPPNNSSQPMTVGGQPVTIDGQRAAWTPTGGGVARVEKVGPIPIDQLHRLLGHTRVRVVPVLDHDRLPAVDAYEIPHRLREALLARHLVEAFPWSTRAARGCELDHTIPYDPAAPAGARQTRDSNLAPLGKRSHRVKTHAGWHVTRLCDDAYHWESPAGYHTLVTPHGTIPLGRTRPGETTLGRASAT